MRTKIYQIIMALVIGICMCACQNEEAEKDTFPQDITRTEWRTQLQANGEMFVYHFEAWGRTGDGKRYRCYGNGRKIDTQTFSWSYVNNPWTLTLTLTFDDTNTTESYTVIRYNKEGVWFSDCTNWESYDLDPDAGILVAGDPIPEELFNNPQWYDFEIVPRWVLTNEEIQLGGEVYVFQEWLSQMGDVYINQERELIAIKGEDKIRSCDYLKKDKFQIGDYKWQLSEGFKLPYGSDSYCVLSWNRPLIKLDNKQVVPLFVRFNPENYGFQYKECFVQHLHLELGYYLRFEESAIYYNNEGAYITPYIINSNHTFDAGINNYIYNLWRTQKNYWFYGEEGIWELAPNTKYFIYGYASDSVKYQSRVAFDMPTLKRVHFKEDEYNISSNGSVYSQADGVTMTGAFFFDVYDLDFPLSNITVTYSHSWLWTAKLKLIHTYAKEGYTAMCLLWANSQNYGSDRTGYIYITVKVKDEYFSHTITVNQKGPNGSGGSSGGGGSEESSLGPEWVKGSAPGYLPYYYCPNTGRTTPSNPVSTNITIYRNSNTGSYKASYAGKLYNAKYGYNKITMESEAHSIYDNIYNYWKTCLDKRYLEFTIY